MARKPTISKLLEKRGIDKIEDLSPEERATFERYQAVLTGDVISVEQIKAFCRNQIRFIEGKIDGITPLTTLQQACIHVYLNILKAIEAPEAERASMEEYLNQLINA